jgi:hypothetical protein
MIIDRFTTIKTTDTLERRAGYFQVDKPELKAKSPILFLEDQISANQVGGLFEE